MNLCCSEEDLIQNLRAASCDEKAVSEFLDYLDCLDYLMYRMQKAKN